MLKAQENKKGIVLNPSYRTMYIKTSHNMSRGRTYQNAVADVITLEHRYREENKACPANPTNRVSFLQPEFSL